MEIDPKLVDRMVTLVRSMANFSSGDLNAPFAEAREIAKLLPEPVDPDLVEAREIACDFWPKEQQQLRAGEYDDADIVQAALVAVKRGRQLALDGRRGEDG